MNLRQALLIGLIAAGPAGWSATAAAECLSPAETRNAVSSGEAVSLSAIKSAVKQKKMGEVIGAKLCRQGGRLVYEITVLSDSGGAKSLSVDARSGNVP